MLAKLVNNKYSKYLFSRNVRTGVRLAVTASQLHTKKLSTQKLVFTIYG